MGKEEGKDGGLVLKGEPGAATNFSIIGHVRDQILNSQKANEKVRSDDDDGSEEEGTEEEEENVDEFATDGDPDSEEEEDDGEEESEEDDEAETEGDSEEEEDDDSEEEEEEDDDEDEDDDDSDAKLAPKKPVYAEVGDGKKIKIPADGKLLVTVDGKEVSVNIHKIISEYSGRYVVDRELGKAKQTVKDAEAKLADSERISNELREIDGVVSRAFESVSKGEGLESFHELVMMSGKYKSPIDWEIEHLKAMIPIATSIADMTVEEQEAYIAKRTADYYKKKETRDAEARKGDPVKTELNEAIRRERQSFKITDDEWTTAVVALRKVKNDGNLEKYGIKAVTPVTVRDYVIQKRNIDRAEKALGDKPGLEKKLGSTRFREIRRLVIEAAGFSVTDDELAEIVTEAVGSSKGSSSKTDDEKLARRIDSAKLSKQTAKPKKKKATVRTITELRSDIAKRKGMFNS